MPERWTPFAALDFGEEGPPTEVGKIIGSRVKAMIDGQTILVTILELRTLGPPSREEALVEWREPPS